MKTLISLVGLPAFGKSLYGKILTNRIPDSEVFHVGKMLHEANIDNEEITKSKEAGKLFDAKIDGVDFDDYCIKAIENLKSETVILDGFPRSIKQAEKLIETIRKNDYKFYVIYLDALNKTFEEQLSVIQQEERSMKNKKELSETRKLGKIKTFYEESLPLIEFYKKYVQVYIWKVNDAGRVQHPVFKHDKIVDKRTGEEALANESYFYPVDVETYNKAIKNDDPVMATIVLANKCDDHCMGCFNAYMNDGAYLDVETLKRVIVDLKDVGFKAVKFAGREPTCYNNLDKAILLSEENCLKTCVITSGSYLSKFKDFFKTHCDHLRISLNAIDEQIHNRYHNPESTTDSFNQRFELTKELGKERKKLRLTTGVTYLIRDKNSEAALEDFIKELAEYVDYIRYAKINHFSKDKNMLETDFSNIDNPFFFSHEYSSGITDNGLSNAKPCLSLKTRIFIKANGDVCPCTSLPNVVFGNINDDSFKNIWDSEERKSFIRETICNNGVCKNTKMCKYADLNNVQSWIQSHSDKICEDYYDVG